MNEVRNSIVMQASPKEVFQIVSELTEWPHYLPHYRWIRVEEELPDRLLVSMACYRGWIPIDWRSYFEKDGAKFTLKFTHLKAFTRGMIVHWDLDPLSEGRETRVTIRHDLTAVQSRWGTFFAQRVIGQFFIHYVATKTLARFAEYFQRMKQNGSMNP